MKFLKNYQWLAPLFLRLAIGSGFIIHGWAKISRGTAGFEKLLAFEAVPLPHLSAQIVPYVELLGGIAILLGLLIRIVSVPLLIAMLVAMFSIQIDYGFSSVNTIGLTESGPRFGPPGYEINLLYIAGLLSLMITGPGRISIDRLINTSRQTGDVAVQ